MGPADQVFVRNTRAEDIDQIQQLSQLTYSRRATWRRRELESHLRVFPEGQFVAVDRPSGRVVGMAASLIVLWNDYDLTTDWIDFTDDGMFTNHDPEHGRTLYGAEVMVHPEMQGYGIGKKLYAARRDLCRRLQLLRIRAGSRLRGYHKHAHEMSAAEYVQKVVSGELGDPTLSFQLRQGFRVIGVVSGYLGDDPESRGYAAIIEWLNHAVARPVDGGTQQPRYVPPSEPQSNV